MKRAPAAVAALALAAAAALVVMPALDGAAGRAVAGSIGALRERLEAAIGLKVSFASMSPSILRLPPSRGSR